MILAANLGAGHCRLPANLAGDILCKLLGNLPIDQEPEPVLDWEEQGLAGLLAGQGRGSADVWGVGVGLPGPVHFSRVIT